MMRLAILGLVAALLAAQPDYLTRLPADLTLKESGPQTFRFVTDYYYADLKGNVGRKERVAADYTRALPQGAYRWNNVTIAEAKGIDLPFPAGARQEYMEGFTYRDPQLAFQPDFFKSFPAGVTQTKTLVWDALMFEEFGHGDFSKLELNRPYVRPRRPQGEALAGSGTFYNRDIELTWTGVSRRNGKLCALIHYDVLFNKLDMSAPGFRMTGRSHYWGDIWVSLQDKHIEYGTLLEDVLGEIVLQGQSAPQPVNVFRRATFEKVPAAR